MSDYRPRSVDIGRGEVPFDTEGKPLAVADSSDTATALARLSTLQGRIEAVERRLERIEEREAKVRRAVGQLAGAFNLTERR